MAAPKGIVVFTALKGAAETLPELNNRLFGEQIAKWSVSTLSWLASLCELFVSSCRPLPDTTRRQKTEKKQGSERWKEGERLAWSGSQSDCGKEDDGRASGGSRRRYRVMIDMSIGLWKSQTPACWACVCVSRLCVCLSCCARVCFCIKYTYCMYTVCVCVCLWAMPPGSDLMPCLHQLAKARRPVHQMVFECLWV